MSLVDRRAALDEVVNICERMLAEIACYAGGVGTNVVAGP